jgi:CTP:molybdopterin cytidylyltransferase MocA
VTDPTRASSPAAPRPGGRVVGVLLAAGAGTRAGRPKALVRDTDGTPWLALGCAALLDGGCDAVVVVLGAQADEARSLVPADPRLLVVVADVWADGLGASLRAGLAAAAGPGVGALLAGLPGGGLPDGGRSDGGRSDGGRSDGGRPRRGPHRDGPEEARCALVSLVDLPGLPPAAVARLLDGDGARSAGALRQAVFHGRPGHPVVIGRDHWDALSATLQGDAGARAYLVAHGAEQVDGSDLWDGADVDRPA